MRHLMRSYGLAAVLAGVCLACRPAAAEGSKSSPAAPPPAPPAASKPAVAASTGTEEGPSVDSLYKGDKIRNPFLPAGSASVVTETAAAPEEFSIHNLLLKGIMRDPNGDFAVLAQRGSTDSFVLKHGRLYDHRNKLVKGVSGSVKPKQKMVQLMTPDKDVQTLILGEEEEGGKKQ